MVIRNADRKKENRILKRIKILLLLLMMAGCMAGSGCAERKSASEQGELVRNERLSEKSGSLSYCKALRFDKKMVR